MEGLMLLGVNIAIIAISAWAIVMDSAPPERVREALDIPPKPRRSRYAPRPAKTEDAPPSRPRR